MLRRMTELRAVADDGRSLTALDDGSGPNLLVVHPGGGDATTWDGVTRRLIGEFRVVRIRRRIYVPGTGIELPHPMATEAADIVTLAGQGHIAHLAAPDALADTIRNAASELLRRS